MKQALLLAALLAPVAAAAQTPKPIEDQANAMAIEGTQILSSMSLRITQDQAAIAELQKQLAAAKAGAPPAAPAPAPKP